MMLKVSFQPGGLFRLLNVPMTLFTDGHAELEAITGKTLKEVHERLPEAANYGAMIQVVEQFLLKKAGQCRHSILPIDLVAQQMLNPLGYHQLDGNAHDACLSVRQFERKFRERVGIGPKLYSRISRFYQAHDYKEKHPNLDWLTVAVELGYTDYNHLAKDFKQFTHVTPNLILNEYARRPEIIVML